MRKEKYIREYIIIILGIFFVYLFSGSKNVYAGESRDISEFIGKYLCDIPQKEEYGNPDVIELYFNDQGKLTRYSGLFYGTTGTTICYEYTSYNINGDTLTCYYDGAYSPWYGPCTDIPGGTHEYVMGTDGSLHSEGHTWYRYLTDEEKKKHTQTLINVEETDFLQKNYSEAATFLGIKELKRSTIKAITFLDTLEQKPENAWDVSQDQDGSVYAWFDNNEKNNLYIGGNGAVIANIKSKSLFRSCINLKKINFNNCFETGNTESMAYMFAGCISLEEIDGIENLDTSNVENMEGLFSECANLAQININSWDSGMAWNYNKMFYNCSSLSDINIDDFNINRTSEYEDIFTGTVREGDCPTLSRERNRNIIVEYIVDTAGFSIKSSSLKAKVVNSYDDVLKDMSETLQEQAVSNTMYAIEDINGDEIPELIIKQFNIDSYMYYAYTYDARQGRVNGIDGFSVCCTGSNVYFFKEDNILACYNDGNYQLYSWKKNQFVETSVISESEYLTMKGDKALSFRHIRPEIITIKTAESVKQEDKTYTMVLYGEKGNYGYVSASLYIDGFSVLTKEAKDSTVEQLVDISGHIMSDDTIWICMRMETGETDDYSGIIRYKDGYGREIMNLRDAVNEVQLIPYEGGNYFEVKAAEDTVGDVSLNLCLNTISYGSDFCFSMDYQYSEGKLNQKRYLTDIENISEQTFTLSKEKNVYEKIASKKVKYTVKAGMKLTPDKIWFANGIIWIRVKNEAGECGWVPMGADTDYLDLSYSYGFEVQEKVDANKDSNVYFENSMIPDGDTLYRLGKSSYESGDYENAVIYCSLIKLLDKNYLDAHFVIKEAKQSIQTELIEEIEKKCQEGNYADAYRILIMEKEFLAEDENYQEYIKLCQANLETEESDDFVAEEKGNVSENTLTDAANNLLLDLQNMNLNSEHPLSYCMIDLNLDGIEEIISRSYTPEATEGGAYVYDVFQYDSNCGVFKHLKNGNFYTRMFDEAVRFWNDMGYLVIDCGTADYYFELYSVKNDKLNTEYETSSDLTYLPVLEFKSIDLATGEAQNVFGSFLETRKYMESMGQLEDISYGIYDLNEDGVCELIIRGLEDGFQYQYWIYVYKEGTVKILGFFENSNNRGDGELYISLENGMCVTESGCAGLKSYSVYGITDKITEAYMALKMDEDELNDEGKYERVYQYSTTDLDGNSADKITTEEQWNAFEESLVEIPLYYIPWRQQL